MRVRTWLCKGGRKTNLVQQSSALVRHDAMGADEATWSARLDIEICAHASPHGIKEGSRPETHTHNDNDTGQTFRVPVAHKTPNGQIA